MDFLRKKLEEVEGEMVATTGTPSRSLADTSKQLVGSSWITRATAAASELQSVATKATTSLQEFSSGAAEMQELREQLAAKDEALAGRVAEHIRFVVHF